jgi:hypothetical protein
MVALGHELDWEHNAPRFIDSRDARHTSLQQFKFVSKQPGNLLRHDARL